MEYPVRMNIPNFRIFYLSYGDGEFNEYIVGKAFLGTCESGGFDGR